MMVSNHFNVVESGVLKTFISDHYLVYVCRKFRGSLSAKHKVITSRQMKNFDKDLFLSDLASVDWSAIVYNSDDVDSAVCQWSRTLSDIIEKHAPLRERRVTERFSPWITPELKQLLRARDKLKIKAVKAKSQLLMNAYKQMRCKANNLNRKLKREHFSSKIELNKGNIKETWKTINQLVNKRSKTTEISTIREGDRVISHPTEIADSMNQFFCSVGKDLSDKIPNKENPLLTGNYGERKKDVQNFAFIPVDPENVMKGCKDFKTSNGYGTDFISVFFLKVGIEVLAPSLAQLFNLSLSTGRFPDSWKMARVAPIHKKGPKDDRSNYRPISVLSVISCLIEKLVFGQLYSYFDRNKLTPCKQSGFRSLHSVLKCLLRCTNDWYMNIDRGEYTAALFIDLKKAYDTVNHEILLAKLNLYSLDGKELNWFKSYLENRRQYCKVNGKVSKTEVVNCGVPQGSCLGPLLFLVYINDLPNCLEKSNVSMYADDTCLYYSFDSVDAINQAINADLIALKGWLEGNKLSLNVAETEAMIIGSNKKLHKIDTPDVPKPQFRIGSEDVRLVSDVKYLGVQVDQELKWTNHLTTVTKRSPGVLAFFVMQSNTFHPLRLKQCIEVW